MNIKIDINTKILSSDATAWRLFPGRGYSSYDIMVSEKRIFLDVPDLVLPDNNQFLKSDDLLPIIAYAQLSGPERRRVRRREAPLNAEAWSQARTLLLSQINALYFKAKVGDLVVVPGPMDWREDGRGGFEQSATLVGEISGPTKVNKLTTKIENSPRSYLTRDVRWYGEVDERLLNRITQQTLRTQNAFVRIPNSALNAILKTGFRNVVRDGAYYAKFTTSDDEFLNSENLNFAMFGAAITNLLHAIETGSAEQSHCDFWELARASTDDKSFIPSESSDIHSPGYKVFVARQKTPIVISVMYALAISCPKAFADPNQIQSIEIVNSQTDSNNPCSLDIQKAVKDTMEMIGSERWKQACEAAKIANSDGGLEPAARVSRPENIKVAPNDQNN